MDKRLISLSDSLRLAYRRMFVLEILNEKTLSSRSKAQGQWTTHLSPLAPTPDHESVHGSFDAIILLFTVH